MATVSPVADVRKMVELFTDVALADPASAALLALGSLFVGLAVVAFGGLSVGGVFTALTRLAEAPGQRE